MRRESTKTVWLYTLAAALLVHGESLCVPAPCVWPQFHGPFRDNISRQKGLAKTWPEGGPRLLWKASGLGYGYSSVAVAGDLVCTAGNIGDDTVITALDTAGKLKWRVKNGGAWKGDHPGSRSTPTIDGSRVYHQSALGNIACINAENGRVLWHMNVLKKVRSKPNFWGLAESLLLDGERLISCPGGPETCMVALHNTTGAFLWKASSTKELAGYASPILFTYKGLRIIATLTARAIIGVDADSGKLLWHVTHRSYADENVMMPMYHDGCLFVSTLATGSVKWQLGVKGKSAELHELWRTRELDNHHGGVILYNGYLYGTSTFRNRNKWVCLDWKTGEKKYVVEGIGKGSLTCAGGMFYAWNTKRGVGLIRPSPESFTVVSYFEIPEGGKGPTWAHPVVCGGRLYLRHGDLLYAYDVR